VQCLGLAAEYQDNETGISHHSRLPELVELFIAQMPAVREIKSRWAEKAA
jgi:hypothetical protein